MGSDHDPSSHWPLVGSNACMLLHLVEGVMKDLYLKRNIRAKRSRAAECRLVEC